MTYRITHRTVYEYDQPVTVSHHATRLRPRDTPTQRAERWRLDILPTPAVRSTRTDYFGNSVGFFAIQELHQGLEIVAESRVRLTPVPPPDPGTSPPWEDVAWALLDPEASEVLEAQQFVFESPHVRPSPELAELARASFEKGRPLLEAMLDFNRRIHREFTFDPEATTVATPVETVLKERRGVCQDFTHLALGGLRSLGLAARYVSGSLRTYRKGDAAGLVGADASHAWLSVFCPRHGWVDFDPTNDLMPSAEHISVAYGRDFTDVSPVTGMIVGGGEHEMRVAVKVEPV